MSYLFTDVSLLEYVKECRKNYDMEVPKKYRNFIARDKLKHYTDDELSLMAYTKRGDVAGLG